MKIPHRCNLVPMCSVDETRPHLSNILLEFEPNDMKVAVVVATDGRCMAIVPVELDPLDVAGPIPKVAFQLARQFERSRIDEMNRDARAEADENDEDHSEFDYYYPRALELKAFADSIGGLGEVAVRRDLSARRPDWRPLVKAAEEKPPRFRIALNAELLVRVQRALGASSIVLGIVSETEVLTVRPVSFDKEAPAGGRGYLMPVRSTFDKLVEGDTATGSIAGRAVGSDGSRGEISPLATWLAGSMDPRDNKMIPALKGKNRNELAVLIQADLDRYVAEEIRRREEKSVTH